MTEDGWIDVRDELPEDGLNRWAVTVGRDMVKAYLAPKCRGRKRCWRNSETDVILHVTHYRELPDLPPPPRPRGPFSALLTKCTGKPMLYSRVTVDIYRDDEWCRIDWHEHQPVDLFIAWLNEQWAKRESALKHRAQLKHNDPHIAARWAEGYYVMVEDRHFIVLDDAGLFEHYLDDAIKGLVEIQVETLEVVG